MQNTSDKWRLGANVQEDVFQLFRQRICENAGRAKKKTFEGLQHVSTTADIWTAYNKSFLGVTAHWINPNNMLPGKLAHIVSPF